MSDLPNLLIAGNGMVGHRFIEAAIKNGLNKTHKITVFGEEPRKAYDRVSLSKYFDGMSAEDLSMLATPDQYEANGIDIKLDCRIADLDRKAQTVTTDTGETLSYDKLILATGSYPFVPPIKGHDSKGIFVYRTIEDLDLISGWAKGKKTGVIIGGGLLGLEGANALRLMGVETHVVEFAPHLMAVQLDEPAAALLKRRVEDLGVHVHCSKNTTEFVTNDAGEVTKLTFKDGTELEADIVVFSAGIRPRDELARKSELPLGSRGGIVVDANCRTPDENIYAIGECAAFEDRCYGLVAPGYTMAEIAADHLVGGDSKMETPDLSTKLKLLGVDVASFGDAFGRTPNSEVVSIIDTQEGVYKKLVISEDRKFILGGMVVRDPDLYGQILPLVQNSVELKAAPENFILPAADGEAVGMGPADLPDSANICSCHNVSKGEICAAIGDGQKTMDGIKACTKAGTGCGSCVTIVGDLLKAELKARGRTVNNDLCEHFPYSRQELYHMIRVEGIKSFDELLEKHGQGHGCEICKPAVASMLASVWNDHILEKEHIQLQDTNDRYLANMQRDGTYSVIPRVAGGEITPDQLIALGQVAKKYNLYSKLTGGQRVDLFGARVDQLPAIWSELIAAGFETGHAYAKSLRTVKSCVGSTWCRYGVQDSVGLAIKLENRYKGLRSPTNSSPRFPGAPASAPKPRARTLASSPPKMATTYTCVATAVCARNTPCCWPRIWMRKPSSSTSIGS